MHRFHFKKGELFCEQVPASKVAQALGTPLYLYSLGTALDHYRKLKAAFAPVAPLICFSMKANGNLALCRGLVQAGAGIDVVSGGELWKALRIGTDPRRIVYASVGKTNAEIRAALRSGILCFNVESQPELIRLESEARRIGKRQAVSLRINPAVEAHTHTFISTGRPADKFGMDPQTLESIFRLRDRFPHLILKGIHIHIGSQILSSRPFQRAIRKALAVIAQARRHGVPIRWLNIGGGLGIVYPRENPQTASEFARAVLPLLKGKGLQLILEPGRFIVGNSGILLTRVLFIKESRGRRFAIVDAGMNDLIRPSFYGAYHEIAPVFQSKKSPRSGFLRYDVVGPICESGDFLARDRRLPPLAPGGLLAVLGAGAYGFAMSSNYNARPRAAEALVWKARWHRVRKRETHRDLIRGETIPSFLQ